MDSILHGSPEMGAQAFKFAVTLFETILDEATAIYPQQVGHSILRAAYNADSMYYTDFQSGPRGRES